MKAIMLLLLLSSQGVLAARFDVGTCTQNMGRARPDLRIEIRSRLCAAFQAKRKEERQCAVRKIQEGLNPDQAIFECDTRGRRNSVLSTDSDSTATRG